MKDSCLDCQFYKHKETVFDGYKEECNGMIRVPKYKTIEHHCTEHPKIFKSGGRLTRTRQGKMLMMYQSVLHYMSLRDL